MKFKYAGIRCLESFGGDLLLTDTSLKHDLILSKDELKKASQDMNVSYRLASKLMKYFERHIDLRWQSVKVRLIKIGETDKAFVIRKRSLIKAGDISALKKLEKDIYFYEQDYLDKLNNMA